MQYVAERFDVKIKNVNAGTGVNNREAVGWYDDDTVYLPTSRIAEAAGGALKEQRIATVLDQGSHLSRRGDTARIAIRWVPKIGRVNCMHCGAANSAAPTRTPIRASCAWWLAMTDAAAILASLDRFIGQLAHRAELISSPRVATQIGPMATTNQLKNKVTNHSYHSGHPKEETFVGADHERCDSASCPAGDSSADLARKVSFVGGYSGKSGKSPQNQSLTSGHPKNVGGDSGNSPSDQQVAANLIGPGSRSGQEPVSPADTFRLGPVWWRDQYEERTRHGELGGRRCRAKAQRLAFGELQWRRHKQHGEQVPPGICGGCQKPMRAGENIPLIDGTYVHGGDGHACLIAYGRRWQGAATRALAAMGLMPPPEETP